MLATFSFAASLLPCCFIHRTQGSFAMSCVVDLRRQTVLQIHQNSVQVDGILLRRLANRKENSGGSVLKPCVFRQISCSASQRDPLKCLYSSREPPKEILCFTYTIRHTYACVPWELMVRKALNNTGLYHWWCLGSTDSGDSMAALALLCLSSRISWPAVLYMHTQQGRAAVKVYLTNECAHTQI